VSRNPFPAPSAGAIRLAKRIVALNGELVDNRKALDAAVEETAPELCELPGVGSVVAASVLTAWSHPGRVRSGAAFAALAGICPIPAVLRKHRANLLRPARCSTDGSTATRRSRAGSGNRSHATN